MISSCASTLAGDDVIAVGGFLIVRISRRDVRASVAQHGLAYDTHGVRTRANTTGYTMVWFYAKPP